MKRALFKKKETFYFILHNFLNETVNKVYSNQLSSCRSVNRKKKKKIQNTVLNSITIHLYFSKYLPLSSAKSYYWDVLFYLFAITSQNKIFLINLILTILVELTVFLRWTILLQTKSNASLSYSILKRKWV